MAVGNVLVVIVDADYMSECADAAALYAVDLDTGAARWSGSAELTCGISLTGVRDTVVTVLAGGSRTEPPLFSPWTCAKATSNAPRWVPGIRTTPD